MTLRSFFTKLCVCVFSLGSCALFAGETESTVVTESDASLTVTTVMKSSAQEIWNVMIDFQNYDRWNVYTIEGEGRIGSTVQMRWKDSDKSWFIDHLDLEIYAMQENKTLCWVDVSSFTWLGAGGWRCRSIKPLPDGRVEFRNHFEFTGIFWRALKCATYDELIKGMTRENEGLQKYLEQI